MSTTPPSPVRPEPRPVAREELEALASGTHVDPHRVLGGGDRSTKIKAEPHALLQVPGVEVVEDLATQGGQR